MDNLPDNLPDKLINAFLEGELDENQAAELSRWVMASKENALYIASLTSLEHGLAKHARVRSSRDILAELEQAEDEAAVTPWYMDLPSLPPKVEIDPDKLTKEKCISALMYVLEHTFTPKRIVTLAAAAVIVLGVLIAVQFIGPGNTDDTQEIADLDFWDDADTSTPPAVAPGITPVATLTAEHDAQWGSTPAERALARGSALHPNQTLTLTAGFAEITTAQGAIAILEAPATIELLDNDNALRLHAGKLVGICETESSKGFVVRTPHMDITDLGTRFGVDANTLATEMHVFEGEVQAMHHPPEGVAAQEQRLTEGDAIRATSADQGFVAVDHDDTGFAALTTFAQSIVDRAAAEVGIAAMSGQLRVADAFTGHDPADWPSGDVARIFEEHRNHALASEISTTISTPGTYRDFNAAESATVPAGTVFRSYILILKPGSPDRPTRAQGQVTFEGEVLGVIANERDWRVFTNAVPGSFYPNLEEQILINGGADGDYITLEPDGRSLSFGYTVSSGAADTVRVIVREPADAPN